MFLDCERSGIKVKPKYRDIRHNSSPKSAKWEGKELSNQLYGVDKRVVITCIQELLLTFPIVTEG